VHHVEARSDAGLVVYAVKRYLSIIAKLAGVGLMTKISATDAKNKFGQVLEMAQAGPVHVQKNGRDVAVVLSPEQYLALQTATTAPRVNPLVQKLHKDSVKRWGRVYEALAK
jgi:prevent-host-death family protein